MRKLITMTLVLCALLPGAATAQVRVPRIGYLVLSPIVEPPSPERAAFLRGLRELGYEAGRNILIEYRSAEGEAEFLPDFAAELVKLNVDLIVAAGTLPSVAAKKATSSIPIVMTLSADPVGTGLVASLARPGGNVTGSSFMASDLSGKRLALLKEIVPRLRRVAVLRAANDPGSDLDWRETRRAASLLAVELEDFPFENPETLQRALESLARSRPDALLLIQSIEMVGYRRIIAEAALRYRLPIMAGWTEHAVVGALASYAPSTSELFRRAAVFVDRILKGARPADLPVEQPTKFELVLNLKTAKTLGIKIPPSVLLRIDRAIE